MVRKAAYFPPARVDNRIMSNNKPSDRDGIVAPLATSGGDSAVPMVLVMIVGLAGARLAF